MSVKDDQIMAQMLSTLGRLEARMDEVNIHVQDSHRALRGYDNERGLVAQTRDLTDKIEAMNLAACQDRTNITDLEKRMQMLEEYLEQYPTLAWLMHHKTRSFFAWVLAGFGLLLLILSPWLDRRFTISILHWMKIPDPIIQFYFPGLMTP